MIQASKTGWGKKLGLPEDTKSEPRMKSNMLLETPVISLSPLISAMPPIMRTIINFDTNHIIKTEIVDLMRLKKNIVK